MTDQQLEEIRRKAMMDRYDKIEPPLEHDAFRIGWYAANSGGLSECEEHLRNIGKNLDTAEKQMRVAYRALECVGEAYRGGNKKAGDVNLIGWLDKAWDGGAENWISRV